MSTLTLKHDKAKPSAPKKDKKITKDVAKLQDNKLKKEQLDSFEQGLTEVVMISRGEMKGTPLSEMWDE